MNFPSLFLGCKTQNGHICFQTVPLPVRYAGTLHGGEWNVEIPLIISNHPDLQHVAERFGIPFYLFPITKENKMEQEKAKMELLEKHNINFIVLARYMQVISEQMIEAYPNRIINIHHSFLPAFVGAKPYHAAFERGVKSLVRPAIMLPRTGCRSYH